MPPFSPIGWQLFFLTTLEQNRDGNARDGLDSYYHQQFEQKRFFQKISKAFCSTSGKSSKTFFFGCHNIIIDIKKLIIKLEWISQVSLCGLILTFTTPLCCAIFEQKTQISVSRLEEDLKNGVKSKSNCDTLYYNKGL